MKCKRLASGLVISALASWNAQAQTGQQSADEYQELDIIMTVVDEDDAPETIYKRIELPPATVPQDNLVQPTLPESNLERELQDVSRAVETLEEGVVGEAARTVTETLNDALSSGDIDSLPDDVRETIPDEVIEDLINDSTDNVDDIVDDVTGDIDGAVSDLESSIEEAEQLTNEADTLSEDAQRSVEDAEKAIDLDGVTDDVRNLDGF